MFKEKIECSEILYIYELFERHIFLIIKWAIPKINCMYRWHNLK